MSRKRLTIHLSGTLEGTVAELQSLLTHEGFAEANLDRCGLAIFLDDGSGEADLEAWLNNTGHCKWRWACMPRPGPRALRRLKNKRDVRFLDPGGLGIRRSCARVLAELYLLYPAKPMDTSMLGQSPGLQQLIAALTDFAPSNQTVLVQGESGTGKELCARFLHVKRGMGRQISVNCAALKPNLVESELFGHERGAFTGANTSRKGLLIEAGIGTCFLDEIGELRPEAQAALLRVLEEREVRPVGGNRPVPMNARLVVATHRDLELAVTEGRFRQDLYHRIAQLKVTVPSLRERMEDLPLLVTHFLAQLNAENRSDIQPPPDFDCFFRHEWPGNVRELLGQVQHAMLRQSQTEGPLDVRVIEQHIYQNHQSIVANATVPFFKGKDR